MALSTAARPRAASTPAAANSSGKEMLSRSPTTLSSSRSSLRVLFIRRPVSNAPPPPMAMAISENSSPGSGQNFHTLMTSTAFVTPANRKTAPMMVQRLVRVLCHFWRSAARQWAHRGRRPAQSPGLSDRHRCPGDGNRWNSLRSPVPFLSIPVDGAQDEKQNTQRCRHGEYYQQGNGGNVGKEMFAASGLHGAESS